MESGCLRAGDRPNVLLAVGSHCVSISLCDLAFIELLFESVHTVSRTVLAPSYTKPKKKKNHKITVMLAHSGWFS